MQFYTTNKLIGRHTPSPISINNRQLTPQIYKPFRKYQHKSYNISQKNNKTKEEVVFQINGQNALIKIMDGIRQNMIDSRKESLMEMTKYRYKKMIQLQNKRLLDKQQFQHELQNSKKQIKNRTKVQANRIKQQDKNRRGSVRSWLKKNQIQGDIVRQQKWFYQQMKIERDKDQLQKRQQKVKMRNKSMFISRPKKIHQLNKTNGFITSRHHHPLQVPYIPMNVQKFKKDLINTQMIVKMNRRLNQSQQLLNNKQKGQSLGLFVYSMIKNQQNLQKNKQINQFSLLGPKKQQNIFIIEQ